MEALVFDSTLTCPECGFTDADTMPTDRCVWYWQCPGCGVLLRPEPGDCCVYCSFGNVPCPPVQLAGEGGCCGPSTEQQA